MKGWAIDDMMDSSDDLNDSLNLKKNICQDIQSDDGQRIAFVYTGTEIYPTRKNHWLNKTAEEKAQRLKIMPSDDRQWAMVDQGEGKGAKLTLIDIALPSEDFARQNGFKAKDYKPVGSVNAHSDILGYSSEFNFDHKEPLANEELEKAVQKWYLRSYADDKQIIADIKADATEAALDVDAKIHTLKNGRQP